MHSHVHRQPLMYLFILRKNSILFNKPQQKMAQFENLGELVKNTIFVA